LFLGAQKITLSAQVLSGPTPVNAGTVTFRMLPAGGGAAVVTFSAAVMNGAASTQFTIPPTTPTGLYKFVAVYHDPSGFFSDVTKTSNTSLQVYNLIAFRLLIFS